MTQSVAAGISSAPSFGVETDKHVLFGLAGETYCVNLLQLQEVIAEYQITVLPNLPEYFHGVIGLRGEVIPILSLRRRFGYPGSPRDGRTRVLVVDMEPNPIGVQVDEVFRVVSIAPSAVGHAPNFTVGQRTPFVMGVSEYGKGRLAIHLNMREVLSSLEKIELAELSESIRASYRSGFGRPTSEPTESPTHTAEPPTHRFASGAASSPAPVTATESEALPEEEEWAPAPSPEPSDPTPDS